MRDRGLLAFSRLDEFVSWAQTKGWRREPTKGRHEVLRLRHPTGDEPAIFYAKTTATVHVTCHGIGEWLVHKWIVERRRKEARP